MNKNIHISKHPLVLDKIARLRDKKTSSADFRRLTGETCLLLAHDALLNAKVKSVRVRTPLGAVSARVLSHDIVFAAVLRAGLGMLDGLIGLYPEAKLAHIGIYREEKTFKPVNYYIRLPKITKDSLVVVLDPMLATGGSAIEAVGMLKTRGAANICFVCLIAAREGVRRLSAAHPGLPVYVGVVDPDLDKDGYIVPGLGDAGDRMFGTN